jgi:hypothetical protein
VNYHFNWGTAPVVAKYWMWYTCVVQTD